MCNITKGVAIVAAMPYFQAWEDALEDVFDAEQALETARQDLNDLEDEYVDANWRSNLNIMQEHYAIKSFVAIVYKEREICLETAQRQHCLLLAMLASGGLTLNEMKFSRGENDDPEF